MEFYLSRSTVEHSLSRSKGFFRFQQSEGKKFFSKKIKHITKWTKISQWCCTNTTESVELLFAPCKSVVLNVELAERHTAKTCVSLELSSTLRWTRFFHTHHTLVAWLWWWLRENSNTETENHLVFQSSLSLDKALKSFVLQEPKEKNVTRN